MQKLLMILVLSLSMITYSCCGQKLKDKTVTGEQNARIVIKEAITDINYKPFYDTLIKNNETAIAVAESILFDIYGKKEIISERPYECYIVDGYWCINGTLPKNWIGGVFEIIISSKDGKVIKLTHGK